MKLHSLTFRKARYTDLSIPTIFYSCSNVYWVITFFFYYFNIRTFRLSWARRIPYFTRDFSTKLFINICKKARHVQRVFVFFIINKTTLFIWLIWSISYMSFTVSYLSNVIIFKLGNGTVYTTFNAYCIIPTIFNILETLYIETFLFRYKF